MGPLRSFERDRESFVAFWRRERDGLYRGLTLTLGDGDLAAEAVDEAMARAWQRWHRLNRYDRPAAWVLRVATNYATSWLRKRTRRPVRPGEELDRPVTDELADVDVLHLLRRLDVTHREVLVVRFLLDWPVDEAAQALGVAEGTVRSRTHRALRQLEQMQEVAE